MRILTRGIGLHFSPAGYEILYQAFIKVISAQWPDQIPENLAMVLPAWNDEAAWEAWEGTQPTGAYK